MATVKKSIRRIIRNTGINVISLMKSVNAKMKKAHFTITSKTGNLLRGVVFINPILHLQQDGESGFFRWKGESVPYQRPRTRDAVYLGLVAAFTHYIQAILSGTSFEKASEHLPAADLIFGTEPNKNLEKTQYIPVADGGTRLSALCEAALNLGLDTSTIIPFPFRLYEGLSIKDMAGMFVNAQKTRNMNINDAINAGVINGQFDDIVERINDAETRGLLGRHTIVSNREEAKTNPHTILLGSFLEWLCWGIFNRSTKKDIFKLSNSISQEAVDNFSKAYVIMTDVVGRKKLHLSKSDRGHCMDSVVFMCVYSRIINLSPLSDTEKKNHLTEEEVRFWLKSLVSDNKGHSQSAYVDKVKPLCSAGKKGMSELMGFFSSKGILIGRHGNKRAKLFRPAGGTPFTFRPELLAGGKTNPNYKPAGIRT